MTDVLIVGAGPAGLFVEDDRCIGGLALDAVGRRERCALRCAARRRRDGEKNAPAERDRPAHHSHSMVAGGFEEMS